MAIAMDVDDQKDGEFRQRLLEIFTERAERVGIRRVRMDDLAAELRVSKRTIYEAFPTKEALVRAFAQAWMDRVQDQVQYRRRSSDPPIDQLRRWARNWSRGNGRISDVLWDDIRAQYPAVYREFRDAQRIQFKDTTDAMRAQMAPEIDHDVAIAMFEAIRQMARDERVCQRLGKSMEEVLTAAVDIWGRGAYARPYDPLPPQQTGKGDG